MTRKPARRDLGFPAALAAALAAFLGACSTNPATGERNFTAFMSPTQEQQVGRQEHPKILKQFGGVYDDPAIAAYVAGIGERLALNSDKPDQRYTFTVLNSPMVNAFALPGGFVYVTRGLMALAGDEAELAGVMAHEIGHVAARHTAQRYSRAVAVGLGAALLGAVAGSEGIGSVANLGAELYLKSFSREQEFEADMLGVRYLARSSYDTAAMASFLEKLDAHSRLEAKLAGSDENRAGRVDFFATHPRAADRVDAAIRAAGAIRAADPEIAKVEYLTRVLGLIFGDDPEQGYVRGTSFIHPELRFRFDVPSDFRLINTPTQVAARGPGGALILFDMAEPGFEGAMASYVRDIWGRQLGLGAVERLDVNGRDGGTGAARIARSSGTVDVRLVAVRGVRGEIFRFVFLTPPSLTAKLSTEFRRTTFSLRSLGAAEAAAVKPHRIKVRAVRPGDTAARLAREMAPVDFPEEHFRVLNGLAPGTEPRVGSLVKYIAE
jgi:predicted Zn-dependent protease